jgi:hypothetical protein
MNTWKVELVSDSTNKRFLTLPANLVVKCTAVIGCLFGFFSDVLLAWKTIVFCLSGHKEPLNLGMRQRLSGLSHSMNIKSECRTPGVQWIVCGHQYRHWKPHLKPYQRLGLKPPVHIPFCSIGGSQNPPMALSPSTVCSTRRDEMT